MTITLYHIVRETSEVEELYSLDPDQEYTGLFVDGKTSITVRAGKEGLGFELMHPTDGIAGKRSFRRGDTLALANDLELEAT